MPEIDRILDELTRDHSGDPWHGSSIRNILDGVTAAQAASRPIPRVHNVWELVLHMTGWKREVARRLSGAPGALPQEGDWPAIGAPTAERWAEALENLDAAHDALIAAVRALPEDQLLAPTNDPRNRETGQGVSYYTLLHGLVQHDAYHGGQLAMVIKVLREL